MSSWSPMCLPALLCFHNLLCPCACPVSYMLTTSPMHAFLVFHVSLVSYALLILISFYLWSPVCLPSLLVSCVSLWSFMSLWSTVLAWSPACLPSISYLPVFLVFYACHADMHGGPVGHGLPGLLCLPNFHACLVSCVSCLHGISCLPVSLVFSDLLRMSNMHGGPVEHGLLGLLCLPVIPSFLCLPSLLHISTYGLLCLPI